MEGNIQRGRQAILVGIACLLSSCSIDSTEIVDSRAATQRDMYLDTNHCWKKNNSVDNFDYGYLVIYHMPDGSFIADVVSERCKLMDGSRPSGELFIIKMDRIRLSNAMIDAGFTKELSGNGISHLPKRAPVGVYRFKGKFIGLDAEKKIRSDGFVTDIAIKSMVPTKMDPTEFVLQYQGYRLGLR